MKGRILLLCLSSPVQGTGCTFSTWSVQQLPLVNYPVPWFSTLGDLFEFLRTALLSTVHNRVLYTCAVSQALPLHFDHAPKLWSTYTLMNYMRTRAITQSLIIEIYPLLDHHIWKINVRLDHVFHLLLLQSYGETTACMI